MNLTDKVLAKLKEQYDFIIGNIAVVYKDLDWVLDSNVALRRQVKKHGVMHPSSYVETGGICNECLDDNPCTFTKEVANDLGIEVKE
jgi:hypothetical protein